MAIQLKVGDQVSYSVKFLRSIACYAGPMAHAKGVITGLKPVAKTLMLAEVTWSNFDGPERVNVLNLVRKDRIAIDSALNT